MGVLLAVAYGLGNLGADEDVWAEGAPAFHDVHVISPGDLMKLVTASDREVAALASRLGTPEEAYRYVRDHFAYDPALPLASPRETLAAPAASCLSKAALLASLYRAMGLEHANVRVMTGQVFWQDAPLEHAWIEIEYGGRCLQQDPTTLFGTFGFDQFEGTAYSRAYVQRELFCFNDEDFAVVSLRNRFRGMRDPHEFAGIDSDLPTP
jgi:hypothetical protein